MTTTAQPTSLADVRARRWPATGPRSTTSSRSWTGSSSTWSTPAPATTSRSPATATASCRSPATARRRCRRRRWSSSSPPSGSPTAPGATGSARRLELKYRLPRLWRRVLDLEVAPWRAFRVAEATRSLPLDGAAFVDRAARGVRALAVVGPARAHRRGGPGGVRPRRGRAAPDADPRHFDVRTDQAGIDGYVYVDGLLDPADALDLDAAVAAGAAQLADLGCEEPLDVRRSMAVGEIARAQLALDLDDHATGRGGDAVRAPRPTPTSRARQTDTPVLVDQVADWCGGAEVTIKPVIDLNEARSVARLRPHRPGRRARPARPGRSACSRSAPDEPDAATSTTASRTARRPDLAPRTSRRCVEPTTA